MPSASIRERVARLIRQFRGDGLAGQLARGGVGSAIAKISSVLLGLLVTVVLARTLSLKGFGIYSFVAALAMMLTVLAQFGLPQLTIRETAKANTRGDWGSTPLRAPHAPQAK